MVFKCLNRKCQIRKEKEMKRLIMGIIFCFMLNSIGYAVIYQVPLNVNGYYQFGDPINFDIDLGVQLTEIHEVRFLGEGNILAIDAPGLFECTFIAGPAQWQHSYGPGIFGPESTSFSCDASFVSSNSATWDFLLDGNANGYVRLITNIIYIPEFPPENITGNITSASLFIDATPVPEPTSILLLGLGGVLLRRRR